LKITFNTGRLYTALGQVVTVLVLANQNATLFMDHSRGISGQIKGCPASRDDVPHWVMGAYDRGCYTPDQDAMNLDRLDTILNVRI
jgi:hypothetical protein